MRVEGFEPFYSWVEARHFTVATKPANALKQGVLLRLRFRRQACQRSKRTYPFGPATVHRLRSSDPKFLSYCWGLLALGVLCHGYRRRWELEGGFFHLFEAPTTLVPSRRSVRMGTPSLPNRSCSHSASTVVSLGGLITRVLQHVAPASAGPWILRGYCARSQLITHYRMAASKPTSRISKLPTPRLERGSDP